MSEFLFVEKYRPETIDECILPKRLKDYFQSMVSGGEIQNMLFCGTAGTGKTTVAKALCNELGCDSLLINASEENGIDILRTKIKTFAATGSFSGKTKVVILDEADYLSSSFQPALRGLLEEFSSNCRFILTCNYRNKIIPALQSRCAVVDFKLEKSEKPKMASAFFKRVKTILDTEGIEYSDKVVAKVIERFFPDYRKVLGELQRYSLTGPIDEGILSASVEGSVAEVIDFLKEKDWQKMRSWVVQNEDVDPQIIYTELFNAIIIRAVEVPQAVLIVADYSYKNAFAANPSITLTACLTELMASVSFK